MLGAGQQEKARTFATALGGRILPESRAYAKIISAEILLGQDKAPDAIEMLNQAQDLTPTWIGALTRGRAYLQASAAADADSEIDKCLKRRGEAASLFLDENPTIRYLPAAYYYKASTSAGLLGPRNPKTLEWFGKFLAIKAHSQPDPLVESARRQGDANAR